MGNEGEMYAIPDEQKSVYYFAVCARGGDCVFYDFKSDVVVGCSEVARAPLLRLSVAFPSMKRARWKVIGTVPLQGVEAEYGKYLHRPVGEAPRLYDNETGESRPIPEGFDVGSLENFAIWDAKHHILPILRYHFYREPTPLIEDIRARL